MGNIKYSWRSGSGAHVLEMAFVQGTGGLSFSFGEGQATRPIDVHEFFIATVPVTQALWTHVMRDGRNPSHRRGERRPVETVSWDDVTRPDGFLARINKGRVLTDVAGQMPAKSEAAFRLPSEAEWEYAARGGTRWSDGFQFSGSNDIDAVAWYQDNGGDQTHEVAEKDANQLGIYDMSGNVWEWCEDRFTRDVNQIPGDGRPFVAQGTDRVLRGGCYHNLAAHCTVSKRYEIAPEYRDSCIGFRLALAAR